ncbi:type VI secretion system baseplate subunit TssF [Azohydromonas caseinilytica]|uniref:Type VI secretion system baseplate subunit TssF n=1 Tax=Azohydromonas caseinilytica TaxID=2728836 RepID=A0A848F881_9BURK|nr:type VI secretion system baseplate subunit TssF [Azohydromonas caseinilytica]NML14925.1 type VI secretion system baseplate subunit TssF [Azohydromonas caseinilytica]
MEHLLPHYEAELRHLHAALAHAAREHPALARRLQITGEGSSGDAQVERLVQAAALLNARVSRRIEDRFPRFTAPLLQMLAPQFLQPFPSCSIAAFDAEATALPSGRPVLLPRGTLLGAPALRGVRCSFRTAFDVVLQPLRVVDLRFGAANAAPGASLPGGATARLSLRLALTAKEAAWSLQAPRPLRLHLTGEPALVAALREALCGCVTAVRLDGAGPWRSDAQALPRPVGFADDEALIDAGPQGRAAHRLLSEYFAFPGKFDFVDLPWPAELSAVATREIELHYALVGIAAGSAQAQQLQALTADHLVPGCTPVVNLLRQRAKAVPAGAPASYRVLVDAGHPDAGTVYGIDRVWCTQAQPGEPVPDIPPLFSFRHARTDATARYWLRHYADTPAEPSPDQELWISLVNAQGEPAPLEAASLGLEVTATHGDLPRELAIGRPGGDLVLQGAGVVCRVRLLYPPTPSRRFELDGDMPWQLISLLSPNHLSLCGPGIEAFREMLCLLDPSRSPAHRHRVQGLLAIEARPVTAWRQAPSPRLVRGTEVCIRVDEPRFAATGLRLFAQLLERFLALYVHANSFTRLRLLSARDQRPLFVGEPRDGLRPLL